MMQETLGRVGSVLVSMFADPASVTARSVQLRPLPLRKADHAAPQVRRKPQHHARLPLVVEYPHQRPVNEPPFRRVIRVHLQGVRSGAPDFRNAASLRVGAMG